MFRNLILALALASSPAAFAAQSVGWADACAASAWR